MPYLPSLRTVPHNTLISITPIKKYQKLFPLLPCFQHWMKGNSQEHPYISGIFQRYFRITTKQSPAIWGQTPVASPSKVHRRRAGVGQVVLANQRGRPRHRGLLATGDQTQGPGLAGEEEEQMEQMADLDEILHQLLKVEPFNLLFIEFQPSKVVKDFFHPRYVLCYRCTE